jgi:hypothetical protein
VPQQTGGRSDPHHEQNGARREQEAEKAQHELHETTVPPDVAACINGRFFNAAQAFGDPVLC